MKTKKNVASKGLLKDRRVRFGALGAALLLVLTVGYVIVGKIGDSNAINDLYVIEQALLRHIEEKHAPPNQLSDLDVKLKGGLNDYSYKKDGGKYGLMELCTAFHLPGRSIDKQMLSPNTEHFSPKGEGAQKYAFHHIGRQCYSISVHKGATSVVQHLSEDEMLPHPTSQVNFSKFVTPIDDLRRKHAATLGVSEDIIKLRRGCDIIAGPKQQKVYKCQVSAFAYLTPIPNKETAKAAMTALQTTLAQQGFQNPAFEESTFNDFVTGEQRYGAKLTADGDLSLEVDFAEANAYTYLLRHPEQPYVAAKPEGFTPAPF